MDKNKFEWTDGTVLEFVHYTLKASPAMTGRYTDLQDFKKSKEPVPLLKTESGEPIYFGDTYWYVIEGNDSISWRPFKRACDNTYEYRKIFSTELAAEEWIEWNRPCLSLKEAEGTGMISASRMEYMKALVRSKL